MLVWPKLLQQWQEPEEKTIVGEQWPRVHNVRTEFGEKVVGIKLDSHVQWHVRPEKHVKGTPAFFLAGPNKVCFHIAFRLLRKTTQIITVRPACVAWREHAA